jgi:hyperosmotically inducible periplasmic protein
MIAQAPEADTNMNAQQLFPSFALLASTSALFGLNPALHASTNDDAIVKAAVDSYVFRKFLRDDHITTSALQGDVTLTGTVADASRKSLAEDTISHLPGVGQVINDLEIQPHPTDGNLDTRITLQVETLFMLHRKLSATKARVVSVNGVATLTGEATSQIQKELATEYTQDVEGVTDVQNHLTIVPETGSPVSGVADAEKVDDPSVTAQVTTALAVHRSTSTIGVSVQTKDGVVTLGGLAKNEAERNLVTRLSQDINGVVHIINEMTIPVTATSQR